MTLTPENQVPNKQVSHEPLIVFLHIPKTAGTSLSHLLRKRFNADSLARIYTPSECARALSDHAADLDESIDCLSGHINYGIHQHLPRECVYFSMLRDPVSRVLSHYYFTRSKDANTHPLGEAVDFAKKSNVVEYLQRYPAIVFEQIRTLSGVNTFNRSALDMAKNNVKSGRIKVGLTEDFFQSTEMIFQEIGLGYPRFAWKRKNTGNQRKMREQGSLDASTLAAIEDICALDIELYQYTEEYHAARKASYLNKPRTLTAKAQHGLFQAYCRLLN